MDNCKNCKRLQKYYSANFVACQEETNRTRMTLIERIFADFFTTEKSVFIRLICVIRVLFLLSATTGDQR